jgi:RNA polymerase sigma-70 factor (ECF subfamily)
MAHSVAAEAGPRRGLRECDPAQGVEEEFLRDLEERYDRILRQNGGALRRVASTYEADSALCEDLFQEICLALWRALPGFRDECSERTFVFRIAHNRGLSHGWKQGKRTTVGLERVEEEGRGELLTDRQDPEHRALAGDRRRRLQGAMRRLPIAARQVLTLGLEGLSQGEIAEVLGIRENTVAVRLHRARRTLREILQAMEGETR